MKLLLFLIRHSWRMVTLALLTGIMAGLSSTGLLALINTALNQEISSRTKLAAVFVTLCLLLMVTRVLSEILLVSLSQGIVYGLNLKLSRRILLAPLRQLEEIGPHKLLSVFTDDVISIANACIGLPLLFMHVIVVIGCLAYLAWLSWAVFLGVSVFIAFGMITYQAATTRAVGHLRSARNEQNALFGHYRAMTEGTKELKLNFKRSEAFLTRVLQSTATQVKRHVVIGNSIWAVASGWGQLLIFCLIGLVIFALPMMRPTEQQTVTGYTIVIIYMMTPIETILQLVRSLGRAQVALQNIETLGLSLAQTTEGGREPPPAPVPSWRNWELKGVTHSYYREQENSTFTLGPLSLSFHPGELVFLIGGNGSGKTTLAKLLTGLYAAEAGEILFNGQPITDRNRDHYREHFSAVFSDFYLFESLLGMEAARLDETASDYLRRLHLESKVQVTDGTLSTINLSQGQRKRLALLTAYLEDRPIYIFDEWAADQDPIFKEIFYLQLLPELKARGKTLIVITHDDKYFHLADRLIKLDYGQVESDTPVASLKGNHSLRAPFANSPAL